MRKLLTVFTFFFFLTSCEEKIEMPEGFEQVSMDGRSHFVYVSEPFWGDNVNQRSVGRLICSKLYQHSDYCEVFFYGNKDLIPKSFPIINRTSPIGVYKIKNQKEHFKLLREG